MSCLVVPSAHIRFLASWAESRKVFHDIRREDIAETLAQANLESYRARYSHREDIDQGEDQEEEDRAYIRECQKEVESHEFKPVEVLKAVQALDYNCSEVKGWETTRAKQHLDWIQSTALAKLPGWDSAPWTIMEDRKPITIALSKI